MSVKAFGPDGPLTEEQAEKAKRKMLAAMLESIPPEIKADMEKAGILSAEALEAAVDIAGAAAAQLLSQLFVLLITKPDHTHTCTLTFPTLRSTMKAKKDPGGGIPDTYVPPAGSFPQAGGAA